MKTIDALFVAATADRRHGAAEIEQRLVDGLLAERRQWTAEAFVRGAARLRVGQPAMANLRTLARGLVDGDLETVGRRLTLRAGVLKELDERFSAAAWPLIEGSDRVLTISRSSAVAAALVGAWRRGWRGETVVFDGSPEGRGPDQALKLAETMDMVRSQPDATVSGWFADTETRVLVGADAVSPLRLVNACGTATLLELAAARSVPVILVADSGKDLPDDELDEILESGRSIVEEGSGRRWRIFEAAPAAFLTHRVHE